MTNKKILITFTLLISLIIVVGGCSNDSVNTGDDNTLETKTLNVTITDQDTGDPLSNVNLTIQTEEATIEGITDSDGSYTTEGKFIKGESYQITATDSYEEHVEPFTPTSNDIFVDFSIENDPTNAVVASDEEMRTVLENPIINTIILAYDIKLSGDKNISFIKDVIIDGVGKHKITGPGSINLSPVGADRSLTFKDITFDPADDITKWYKESDSNPPRYNYIISVPNENHVLDVTFDNITVDIKDKQDVPGTFYLCTSSGDLTVVDSNINIENHQAFDMNRGGTGTIKNNDFSNSMNPLYVNNHYPVNLTIENNNFEDLTWGILHISASASNNNIIVNNNELIPINRPTSTQDSYESQALDIHQSIADNNKVKNDYLTRYYDDKMIDDKTAGVFYYKGDSNTPVYLN